MMDQAANKAALRATVIGRRDGMAASHRADASAALDRQLQSLPEWQAARTVLLYLGIRSEYDPRPLAAMALACGRTLVLPRMLRAEHRLEVRRVSNLTTDLLAGVWDLQEPDPQCCPLVPLADIDLVLVPGVAFDLAGGRMGYGAGFYDRLLALPELGAVRVAALFREQLVAAVPRDSHDLPVDLLVLPDGLWRLPPRSGAET